MLGLKPQIAGQGPADFLTPESDVYHSELSRYVSDSTVQ